MPVSRTRNVHSPPCRSTSKDAPPFSVYFAALASKLMMICSSRTASRVKPDRLGRQDYSKLVITFVDSGDESTPRLVPRRHYVDALELQLDSATADTRRIHEVFH